MPGYAWGMKAYSYIRWSSGSKEIGGYGQSSGDSLRRQIEETEKFCKAKGWHLDEEKMVDVSVSGYKGKNVSKGALGEFIRAVDNGEIPVPCICVIEQLDRLKMQESKPTDVALLYKNKLAENERKLEKLNKALLETDTPPRTVLATMSALEKENEALRVKIDSISVPVTTNMDKEFNSLSKHIKDVEYRIRLRNMLGRVVDNIVVDGVAQTFTINPRWKDPKYSHVNFRFVLSNEPQKPGESIISDVKLLISK
jgi:hypothetical protein